MVLPVAYREQRFFNKIQARFCCPERQIFTDTIEQERSFGLWVSFGRILNQPQHLWFERIVTSAADTDMTEPISPAIQRIIEAACYAP